MGDARISQVVVESVGSPTPDLRVSQIVVESVGEPTPNVRISQVVLEVISTAALSNAVVVSHLVVESITPFVAESSEKSYMWLGDWQGGLVWID